MPEFSYRILSPRPGFAASLTEAEKAVMGAHFVYLQRLSAEGRIRFVGRTENGDWGLVVFEAEDEASAQAIAGADPAVETGTVGVEVHRFVTVPMD
jgi:uncharacterized protein YciI